MISPILPRFDRSRHFVVLKPIQINGIEFKHGETVPKEQLSDRRLRQLFDLRFITIDDRAEKLLADLQNGNGHFQTLKKRYSELTGSYPAADTTKEYLIDKLKEMVNEPA